MTTPIIILGLLSGPLLFGAMLQRLTNRDMSSADLGCVGIMLVFCFTGVGHFVKTEPMSEMLPPWMPSRISLVYVTGLIEIAAAVTVLVPRRRPMVGWFLIVLLFCFLPVNIYAAVKEIGLGGHQWGPMYLLIRIPLQAILIGWIWWFAVRCRPRQAAFDRKNGQRGRTNS